MTANKRINAVFLKMDLLVFKIITYIIICNILISSFPFQGTIQLVSIFYFIQCIALLLLYNNNNNYLIYFIYFFDEDAVFRKMDETYLITSNTLLIML